MIKYFLRILMKIGMYLVKLRIIKLKFIDLGRLNNKEEFQGNLQMFLGSRSRINFVGGLRMGRIGIGGIRQ